MIKFENDCVCCDLPCIDCGRKHAPHYYCNECNDEIYDEDDIYEIDEDYHLCPTCWNRLNAEAIDGED